MEELSRPAESSLCFGFSFDWSAYHINDDLSKRTADFRRKPYAWTDVWTGKTGDTTRKLEAKVPSHGTLLLRLKLKT